jgi:hypothetical protein
VILAKDRDPRLVTIRRGGTLTDTDHALLALWAASCAEHVLGLFEAVRPADPRPREAIEAARAWVRGELKMMQARAAGGHAMGAARDLSGAARFAAYAAGQAGVVAHVAAHELGAAAYAIKAVRAAALEAPDDPRGAAGGLAEGNRSGAAAGSAQADRSGAAGGSLQEKRSGAAARLARQKRAEEAGRLECRWQRDQLPAAIRELVLDDQRVRNDICWSVFDC